LAEPGDGTAPDEESPSPAVAAPDRLTQDCLGPSIAMTYRSAGWQP
jgi:hypothetical protein